VTFTGGVGWYEDGAVFNGSSSVGTTNDPVLNTAVSYSYSVWAKPTAFGVFDTVVSQGGTKNCSGCIQYSPPDHTWRFVATNTDVNPTSYPCATASSPAALGTWTHLVGVFEASSQQMRLYVNGSLSGSGTNPTPWSGSGPLSIGSVRYAGGGTAGTDGYFSGGIANVQLYQRALSAAEAATLYARGRGGTPV